LIEYTENLESADGFQPGIDYKVADYPLWSVNFTPMVVTTPTASDAQVSVGSTVTQVCTNSVDGVVYLCSFFTDVDTAMKYNGSTFQLSNNAMHHSVRITNFHFLQANSRLALKVQLEVVSSAVDSNDTSLSSFQAAIDLSTAGSTRKPVYLSNTNVTVSGYYPCNGSDFFYGVTTSAILDIQNTADLDVIPDAPSTFLTDTNLEKKFVYYSFLLNCPEPPFIYWDPDLGIVDDSNFSHVVLPSLTFVLFLLFSFQ